MTDSKKEVIVYQANPLVEGRRDFTLIETRLFYLGLKDLKPQLTNKNVPWNAMSIRDFPTTIIPTKEIIELFGNDKYYNTLKDICRGLAKKYVEIEREDGKGFSERPVFLDLTYTAEEGLRLVFSPFMVPYLLELADKPFTKIPVEQIWLLQSQYAVRLLELLLQYQNTKTHERTMTIEELRRCLNVPEGAYKDRVDIFRQRVIDSSIKEINEKTAYKIEYEKIKDGRKIVGFKFKLHLPAELKKEKRAKQIKDIGKVVENLAQEKDISSDSQTDEKKKNRQADLKKLMENLKEGKTL